MQLARNVKFSLSTNFLFYPQVQQSCAKYSEKGESDPESEQTVSSTRKLKWDNYKLVNFTRNITELSDLFQSLSLSLEQDDSENNINDN